MSEAFKSIEQGLKEALAHVRGERMATVHEIELSEPDVQAIRADTGQSKSASDGSIGRKKSRRLNRG